MNPFHIPGASGTAPLRPVTQSAYIAHGIHHQLIQNRSVEIHLSGTLQHVIFRHIGSRSEVTVIRSGKLSIIAATGVHPPEAGKG